MQNKVSNNYLCIFRTAYQSEIAVIESLLIDNKIPYYIDNYNFASFGSADGSINYGVMVQSSYKKEAQELLKEFIKPVPTEEALSYRKEHEIKSREKYAFSYLILGIFGLVLGVGFLTLAILAIRSKLSFESSEGEIVFKFIFILLFGIISIFMIKGALKEIILIIGILKKRNTGSKERGS